MRYLYLTLVFFLSINQLAFSQSDSAHLTTIASKLEKLSATHPVEKVYLHFNKPAYNLGDTIWFKGYVTVGTYHQPSALSGVLYVEFIDGTGKILQSLQLKNSNGISVGDFTLDNKIVAGDYHVRAYTAWMRNAGPQYFFNGAIAVKDVKANSVFVNSSYSISNNSNNESVNAKLVYTDKQGRPFNNREINYEVRADTNLLYKGKGITDATGNIAFTFPGKTAPGQRVNVISHVKIVNGVIIDKTTPLNIQNENIDIQFFPEGGQLINDVRSKVAFKAIGTNGLGVDVKGIITDNDNNEVAEFTTQHAGMGVFALTPQAGKTYTAKITLADNLTITQKLPVAADKGFVLAINNNDSTKLTVRVATNAATLDERKGQSFYLVGQSGGVVYYTTLGKLDNQSFTASVPKNKFPTGIAQFTLFSSTNEPLNERVVFIQNNNDVLKLSLSAPKTIYAPKEKVSMAFLAKDNTNKPVLGSFSLSVYNEDLSPVNENAESTILSNILLTSDLKGFIEQPNYYFNNQNEQPDSPEGYHEHDKQADLDILMLTQGYRRFDWMEIINDNYPAITYQPERSLSLSGQITTLSGKPVAKGKVSVLAVADNQAGYAITDEQGRFILSNLDLANPANVILKAQTGKGDNRVNIKIDSKSYPLLSKNDLIPIIYTQKNQTIQNYTNVADTALISEEIKEQVAASGKISKDHQLNEVDIKARRNAGTELAPWVIVNPHSANLNGPGHADFIITAKQLEDCPNLSDCFQARIAGILFDRQQNVYFSEHAYQSISHPPPITFIIDGTILTGHTLVDLDESVIASSVETIEVLKSGSYLSVYGSGASGGALIITTKVGTEDIYGDQVDKEQEPGVLNTKVSGYTKAREFYVPKYIAQNNSTPDTRTAIYWNPNIVTDDKGTFPIEYFNSDVKGTYRAVIEGIDNDGNIGRYVYRYKVE